MHYLIQHLRNLCKNHILITESDYEIVHSNQSEDNPPPSSQGANWIWVPSSASGGVGHWSLSGQSSWFWDYNTGQWLFPIGSFGGANFYLTSTGQNIMVNGEDFLQAMQVTPDGIQSNPAQPGYNVSASRPQDPLNSLFRPGVGIYPGEGQPGTSILEIAHWFDISEILNSILHDQNPFGFIDPPDPEAMDPSDAPGVVDIVGNLAFFLLLEQLFETAYVNGWRYELAASTDGKIMVRFFHNVYGYLTNITQAPYLWNIMNSARIVASQMQIISNNIRTFVIGGGTLGALTSAQLLEMFGGAAGIRLLTGHLIAAGLTTAGILGLIGLIGASVYAMYSQTGYYTQENIDLLLDSLLNMSFATLGQGNYTEALAQFMQAWEALFGTAAPPWFSSTGSSIDWNSLPDWLRDFLINNVQTQIPAPKPTNIELFSISPELGQPGYVAPAIQHPPVTTIPNPLRGGNWPYSGGIY